MNYLLIFFFLIAGLFVGVPADAQSTDSVREAAYISPNNDGVKDSLVVPFSIRDKRYIMEWNLTVKDSEGTVVRTIGNKVSLPGKITVPLFFKILFSAKTGVAVPARVTWDGTDDAGNVVSDGRYFYAISAADDNGNRSTSEPREVVVDNTPPVVTLVQPGEGEKFFGAGDKAAITIRQSGSAEERWTGTIFDAGGNPVNIFTWENGEPGNVTWDGKSGTLVFVDDGVYSYSIEAVDRAGNRSNGARVTNIVYSGEKPQPKIAISGSRYFSPNGDGVKDTVTFDVIFPETSSANALVNSRIAVLDRSGAVIATAFEGRSPARRFVFGGLDARGAVLPEGSYWAEVTAEYRNGFKSAPARSPRFDLDITPPAVTRLRGDGGIFSPDGDGVQDTFRADFATNTSGSAVDDIWFAEIIDSAGRVVRTFDLGAGAAGAAWDGLDESGALAADGRYRFRMRSEDLAGNRGDSSAFPVSFDLDTSKTELLVSASPLAFSPNGDRVQDSVTFRPVVKAGGGVANYALEVKNAGGDVVKTFRGTGSVPSGIAWDGKGDNGNLCADGNYSASLVVRAANGSENRALTGTIKLDTVFPAVEVGAEYTLFSPDKDPQNRKKTIPLKVDTSSEGRWDAAIFPVASAALGGATTGSAVRTFTWRDGKALLSSWDGTDDSGNVVSDGAYRLEVWAEDEAGNKSVGRIQGITVDTRSVRSYLTEAREAFSPISPRPEARVQRITLAITPNDGIDFWKADILSEAGVPVKTYSGRGNAPPFVEWDGKLSDGTGAEGKFRATLHVDYAKGNYTDAAGRAFLATSTPPALQVTTAPEFFSPDNDGVNDELHITLGARETAPFASWSFEIRDPENGKRFWYTGGGASITDKLVWDGRGNGSAGGVTVESAMDYPYTFTVSDTLGLSSAVNGVIPVDILVILLGDGRLKIRVPSIYFKSNSPEFDDTRKATNERVLKRVGASLNRFKDYTVIIEGHSNKVSSGVTSEANLLTAKRLSEQRAQTVSAYLVKNGGVSALRLSTTGKGESEPLAAFEDHDNWWKNRRVEFILNK